MSHTAQISDHNLHWNVLNRRWMEIMTFDRGPRTYSPLEAMYDASVIKSVAAASSVDLFAAHRFLSRNLARGFLLKMASAHTEAITQGRTREEQYKWLQVLADSSLEKEFLAAVYDGGFNLPDNAQNRPTQQVAVQPDFYYERNNTFGVCVFVDGPSHDTPETIAHDGDVRGQLEDLGFRVIVIQHDKSMQDQIADHPDEFDADER